jgi:hypothetical protein
MDEIVRKGLGTVERASGDEDVVRIPTEVGERITFGQLYGELVLLFSLFVTLSDVVRLTV